MTIYPLNDPTCSTAVEDMSEPLVFVVAQFLDTACDTSTITEPYQSILGNILTSTSPGSNDFPSFTEGVLYTYYGTAKDCLDDTMNEETVAGFYWTDLFCKHNSRYVKNKSYTMICIILS